ncbi:unnamed protein product [Linum trigynum]|uniref:Uncharacterized protein n=1 Tax=Linum trigynum TaxID=586398 RepID=A0AAV2G0X2_9ROSI
MEKEGYVKGKNMSSCVYSRRIREKTVLPVLEPEVVLEPDTVVEPEVELPVVKFTTDVEEESEPVVEVDVEVSVVKPSAEVATEVELESIVEHEVEVLVVKSSTNVEVPVVDPEVREVPVVDPEVQHTKSIFGQVNVMQIALQTPAAAEESIETSPTTVNFGGNQ